MVEPLMYSAYKNNGLCKKQTLFRVCQNVTWHGENSPAALIPHHARMLICPLKITGARYIGDLAHFIRVSQ